VAADTTLDSPAVVVMAKPAAAGAVKTRLIGALTEAEAAAVHQAMLRCVLSRARHHLAGPHYLALAEPAGGWEPTALPAEASQWRHLGQGEGDLGERLKRVWRGAGAGPVVFLGVDSPDVPATALAEAGRLSADVDVAVGPAADGGYWTLAASGHHPAVLERIDWGSERVYRQTARAARAAGLRFKALPRWYDVDDAADFRALLERLQAAAEPSLRRLRDELEPICGPRL